MNTSIQQGVGSAPLGAPLPAQVDEYELIRPLGRGATGQVYQALDTVLGRVVAVKFLAAENPTEAARERFLIEARAIARVQHPNIVSIYRVGIINGRPYLAQEFLRGQSLDNCSLPQSWRRTLDIALQLSRGLVAAHRHGVLHRDIKPGNVVLTDDGVAKLLDFGLAKLNNNLALDPQRSALPRVRLGGREQRKPGARLALINATLESPTDAYLQTAAAAAASSPPGRLGEFGHAHTLTPDGVTGNHLPHAAANRFLTIDGSILGTPAYMAPEAWRGETATAATDIYSLGVLLYELCSGQLPHNYQTAVELRTAAMKTSAVPLGELVPDIDWRFAEIINRCIDRDPALRFESAEELQAELEELSYKLAAPTARALVGEAIRRRWPIVLFIAALLLLPSVATLAFFYQTRAERRRAAEPSPSRRAVAVLGLVDRSPGAHAAGFVSSFAELLSTELAVGEHLRRIPLESVERMKLDFQMAKADHYGPLELSRIRQRLGAELVVTGAIEVSAKVRDALTIRIEVTDSQTAAPLAEVAVSGRPGELFELVKRAGSKLRQQLGTGALSAAQEAALRAVRPANPTVAELYAQGRELVGRGDAVAARRLLEQVIALDPDYALGHLAMADVWAILGYDEKAKTETKRAFALSSGLPREDRYVIEARYREAAKEWDQALAIYQSLLIVFPESVDYGLAVGRVQLNAGQPDAARATAAQLRKRLESGGRDPRISILEGKAFFDAGELPRAQRILEHAAIQGAAMGAPLFTARAHLEEAYVLVSMGQLDRALNRAMMARDLFIKAGDRSAAADAIMAVSSAYVYLGDISRAMKMAEEAQALLLQLQNSALTAANLCNLGLLLVRSGNFPLAQARAEAGLLLAREIGLLDSVGGANIDLGWLALLAGKVDLAMQHFQQSEESFSALGDPRMLAWANFYVAQTLLAKGDLAAARQKHETALARREKSGLAGFAAESQAALAVVALAQRLPAEAETRARAAAEQFATEQQADNEASAQAILAEALTLQGKHDEAQRAIARTRTLIAQCQDLTISLVVRRKMILLQLKEDKSFRSEVAQRQLTELLTEAHGAGMVSEEYENQLAQYEISSAHGAVKNSARPLHELAETARQQGLGLLAARADSLISILNY